MNNKLRGFYFTTEARSRYYYDDCSGICFPCTDEFKKVLDGLKGSTYANLLNKAHHDHWEKYLINRFNSYGAFFGSFPNCKKNFKFSPKEYEKLLLDYGLNQLILIITGHCNLRCSYCIYSENYPPNAISSIENMTLDIAKKAIDFYFNLLIGKRIKKPKKKAVINFYGGEPLLEFQLIKDIISYIEKKYNNYEFHITTNGLLLNEKIANYLVQKKFRISISLDGPKSEHDRNRVLHGNHGSFDQVFSNIEKFWQKYPQYKHICFLVTYDIKTDLHKLKKFFSRKKFKNTSILFNSVSGNFSDYYKQFSKTDLEIFKTVLGEFDENIHLDLLKKDPFTMFFTTLPYRRMLMRNRITPFHSLVFPATATCMPGYKLCVLPNGDFQPCERVNGLNEMGSVETGLDYDKISLIISDYNEKITKFCNECPILRLCSLCFADFWSGDEFVKQRPSFCKEHIESNKYIFSRLYSLLEKNPTLYDLIKDDQNFITEKTI